MTSADFEYIRDELPRLERERIDRERLALEQTRLITAEEQEALMGPNGEGLEYDNDFLGDGFDRVAGKPWYDFCVVLWPWEDPDDSHYLVAVGDHLCVTPPVIPQPED